MNYLQQHIREWVGARTRKKKIDKVNRRAIFKIIYTLKLFVAKEILESDMHRVLEFKLYHY